MHKVFKGQHIFFYPQRLIGVNFDGYEIHPMKFDNTKCDLSLASECRANKVEFYSVFVTIPDQGRDCIADCATKELASQLVKTLSLVGEMYMREQ